MVGAMVATGLTVVWLFVVPEQADQTHGLQAAAIRWGHPATWALLALFGALVALDAPKPIRDTVAWASLACYAAFWAGLLFDPASTSGARVSASRRGSQALVARLLYTIPEPVEEL